MDRSFLNKIVFPINLNHFGSRWRLFVVSSPFCVCHCVTVSVNKQTVKMPPLQKHKDKKSKKKKARKMEAFRFIQPLDISSHAMNCMTFEIACHKAVFHGAASIEIVNLLTVDQVPFLSPSLFPDFDILAFLHSSNFIVFCFFNFLFFQFFNFLIFDWYQIALRVEGTSRLASNLHSISEGNGSNKSNGGANGENGPSQKCKICGKSENLSRCSRCKATWYCSRAHQEEDWTEHCLGCKPYEELNRLRLQHHDVRSKDSEDDDHIICDEIKVSIRDPLSLCRIQIPIRGTGCHHPQCVDLKTYLNYCHHTKTWQCPICMQPLMPNDLAVDHSMARIIKEVSSEVDQVRLNPDDYSYKVVCTRNMRFFDFIFSENI